MAFAFDGYSKVGYKRETNEDFVFAKELTSDSNTVLAIVADGAGSQPSQLQPAQIACRNIESYISRVFNSFSDKVFFYENASMFLKESLLVVNSVLGAFRTANEEIYSGFSCALTAVLFYKTTDGTSRMSFAHSGNTRLYMLRRSNDGNAILRQLTKDHTFAQKLVDDGQITEEQYYFHDLRNKLLTPIGIYEKPVIDTFDVKIRDDCLFLLTTDGVHYAIRPDAIAQLVLENDTMENACTTLCDTAENLQYNDDYAAVLVTSVNV